MKKLLTIVLASFISLASMAQTKTFIQGGVSAGVTKVINENLEVGVQNGHNRLSVVGQSYDDVAPKRQYLVGVKYVRSIGILPNFEGLVSLAGKTNTRNVSQYQIEPGVGVDFHLGRGVSFITGVSSPVTQSSFTSRTATFAGNAALKFDL